MLKGLLLGVVVLALISQVAVAQSSLVLELRMNNTDHTVYVPGTGELASSGLGSRMVFSSPTQWYVASYLSGLLAGLAGGSGESLSTEGGTGYHIIGFEQALGEPVFLAFSEGDWQAIDRRAGDMESGDFLDYVSPSFAFGLGSYHPLTVALRYSGIDLEGSLSMSKGVYKLVIENKGKSSGRPLVEVTGG